MSNGQWRVGGRGAGLAAPTVRVHLRLFPGCPSLPFAEQMWTSVSVLAPALKTPFSPPPNPRRSGTQGQHCAAAGECFPGRHRRRLPRAGGPGRRHRAGEAPDWRCRRRWPKTSSLAALLSCLAWPIMRLQAAMHALGAPLAGGCRIMLPEHPHLRCPQPCNNPKFGDYQCNNAMALHGRLKGQASAARPAVSSGAHGLPLSAWAVGRICHCAQGPQRLQHDALRRAGWSVYQLECVAAAGAGRGWYRCGK